MSTFAGTGANGLNPDDIDIVLSEYEESKPITLSESADRILRHEINGGPEKDGDRIEVRYQRDGQAILKAKQYVGVIGLPNGPTIEIQPKATGTNLLHLLRYSQGVEPLTAEQKTKLRAGDTFIDALAAMFDAELSGVLDKGLSKGYRERQSTEQHLRGRLDLQRQIQRQGLKPTAFESTYSELTQDTIVNRAILYATSILIGLTQDRELTQSLQRHQQVIRRQIELRPVSPEELEHVQLNRLNNYYTDILRLTRLVLQNINIAELERGSRPSFGLLVNMNSVFESVVTRAATSAIQSFNGWRVVSQDRSQNLVEGGNHSVTLKPDLTIYDGNSSVQLVADAKWKTGSPTNADFYQIASYQLAHDVPGILIYPQQEGAVQSRCVVANSQELTLMELPTSDSVDSYQEFSAVIEERMAQEIESLAT